MKGTISLQGLRFPTIKNLRLVLIFVLTLVAYVLFYLFVPLEALVTLLEKNDVRTAVITALVITALIYTLFLFKRFSDRQIEISRKLKHYKSMLAKETHAFNVLEARKEIQIWDERGKGRITYFNRCKNTLDMDLEYIRHDISHDGTMVENSLKCFVNARKVTPSEIERLLRVDPKTREPRGAMPNIFKFSMPCEPKIKPGAVFKYQYGYEGESLYPKVTERGAEYTQMLIMHPTDRLEYVVIAPKTYVFVPEMRIEVLDRYGLKHMAEEARTRRECPPTLADNRRMWLWVINDPRLTNIYRLYFSLSKEKPNGNNM